MMRAVEGADTLERDLGAFLAEINASTVFFHPPEGFDPLSASPHELKQNGIPPKPDRLSQPKQYAFWTTLFSPPLRFVAAMFAFAAPQMRLNPLAPLPAFGTRHETSLNWSGAYITPKQDRMFTAVYGSWRVPTPNPPLTSGQPVDGDYRSSTWIGLDGQRRYLNSSLPQIGTAQFVKVVGGQPAPHITAWWQWWLRGQKLPPITLNLPVQPGDLVIGSLVVINSRTVRFFSLCLVCT